MTALLLARLLSTGATLLPALLTGLALLALSALALSALALLRALSAFLTRLLLALLAGLTGLALLTRRPIWFIRHRNFPYVGLNGIFPPIQNGFLFESFLVAAHLRGRNIKGIKALRSAEFPLCMVLEKPLGNRDRLWLWRILLP